MTPISRRTVLLGTAVVAAGGYGAWFATRARTPDGVGALSVQAAHQAAQSGDILLIDIRRPDEWRNTGVPEGAHPIDMRRDDFVAALNALAQDDTSRPIALICARGVRSARLSSRLMDAGYTNLVDVPEGMLGSRAGPGWIAGGLPVVMAP